jgi:hypothetical protein
MADLMPECKRVHEGSIKDRQWVVKRLRSGDLRICDFLYSLRSRHDDHGARVTRIFLPGAAVIRVSWHPWP